GAATTRRSYPFKSPPIRPMNGSAMRPPSTESIPHPPILCTHLPSESPRTATHPRPRTIVQLTSDTHHLLCGIQVALSPIAYEMLVVTNIPPSAMTMIDSNHKFHATMKPANSLKPSLAH